MKCFVNVEKRRTDKELFSMGKKFDVAGKEFTGNRIELHISGGGAHP